MKRAVIILTLLLSAFLMNAQDSFKQDLNGISKIKIESDSAIKVIGSDTNVLILDKYSSRRNHHDDQVEDVGDHDHDQDYDHYHNYHKSEKDRAKGLKAVYAGGVDNTGFGMHIKKDGDELLIRNLKSYLQRSGVQLTIPENIDVVIDCGSMGSADLKGLTSEIEVKSNIGDIKINDATGPITAHSSTGTIEVKFNKVNQDLPISLYSSVGEVDVSLPANTKADLELRTTMGTVYTDFDIKMPEKDGLRSIGHNRKISTKLNDGGVKIKLSSSTGNIYLRKQ